MKKGKESVKEEENHSAEKGIEENETKKKEKEVLWRLRPCNVPVSQRQMKGEGGQVCRRENHSA